MTMNHHPNHPIRSMRCKLAMIVLKIPKAVEIIVPSLEITIVVVTFYHFRIRHRPVWSIAVIVVVWFHRPPHPNVHPPRLCKYRMMWSGPLSCPCPTTMMMTMTTTKTLFVSKKSHGLMSKPHFFYTCMACYLCIHSIDNKWIDDYIHAYLDKILFNKIKLRLCRNLNRL